MSAQFLLGAAPKYLTYGVPIPIDSVLDGYPEPYQPAKHGPALPNSLIQAAPDNDDFDPAPGLGRDSVPPPDVTNTESYALIVQPITPTQFYGIYQNNDVELSLTLPAATAGITRYLYAPTVLPTGGTCVEATTIHERSPGQSPIHKQGWYNWCWNSGTTPQGRWESREVMNAAFQNKYVRTFGGEPGLSISIVTPNDGNGHGGCWYGHLYNFQVGGWEQKFAYCGGGVTYSPSTHNGNDGWTAWESAKVISVGNCPTLPSIRAQLIQLYVSSSGGVQYLEDFTPSLSTYGTYCWTNWGFAPYTFDWPSLSGPGTWKARLPNP